VSIFVIKVQPMSSIGLCVDFTTLFIAAVGWGGAWRGHRRARECL